MKLGPIYKSELYLANAPTDCSILLLNLDSNWASPAGPYNLLHCYLKDFASSMRIFLDAFSNSRYFVPFGSAFGFLL